MIPAVLAEKIFKKYADRLGLAQIAHTNGLIAIYEKNYVQAQALINYAVDSLTELNKYYFLFQVKLTKVHLEIQLENYICAKDELAELDTLLMEHFSGNALQAYNAKLTEKRRQLELALADADETD